MPKTAIKKICIRAGLILLTIVLLFLGLTSAVTFSAFWNRFPYIPQMISTECKAVESGCLIQFNGTSVGYYTELGQDGIDLFQIELDRGQRLEVALIIPDETLSSVRVPVMEISGIKYQESESQSWLSGQSYKAWILAQEAVFEAPQDGMYDLKVYDLLGEPGEYALIFGGVDPVRPLALIKLVIGSLRINFK
ncbi:MAG: hypothetical protein ABIH67_03985 [Candidatus Uhrbacteria bacterium]